MDDALSSNFEWKKKSFGKKEKFSRRINEKQATYSEEEQKNKITNSIPITNHSSVNAGNNIKKIRKTIRQVFDEDDEDEDGYISSINIPLFLKEEESIKEESTKSHSLFDGLNDSEKRIVEQKNTIEQMQLQQNASKIAALHKVNYLAKKSGISPLSDREFSENLQNNGWSEETFKMAIENYIAPGLKSKKGDLTYAKAQKLMKGLKRLQKIGGIYAAEGMKTNDVIRITNKKYNDERVAKMLLKKTGRKLSRDNDKKREKKQNKTKISFKQLLQQKKQQDKTFTKV